MKRTIKILISILSINLFTLLFSGCDESHYGTCSIESISLERLGKNILDYRIIHQQTYSPGYKEKMFMIFRNEKIDTVTIQYFINKEIIFFNETISAKTNLWKDSRTKKHITFTKTYESYSDLVFDSVFYNNSSIDTVGLIITFKVKANDGLMLMATTEE
jgi:hypothetical protein